MRLVHPYIFEVIQASEGLRCLQLCSFTGLSQNPQHDCDWKKDIQRMVKVRGTLGDDLVQEMIQSKTCLKQSQLEQLAQNLVTMQLELDMSSD